MFLFSLLCFCLVYYVYVYKRRWSGDVNLSFPLPGKKTKHYVLFQFWHVLLDEELFCLFCFFLFCVYSVCAYYVVSLFKCKAFVPFCFQSDNKRPLVCIAVGFFFSFWIAGKIIFCLLTLFQMWEQFILIYFKLQDMNVNIYISLYWLVVDLMTTMERSSEAALFKLIDFHCYMICWLNLRYM